MSRLTGAIAIAAVLAALPAQAAWRVVGPGMAVDEARTGAASLTAECVGDGMVLGVYNVAWDFGHAEEIALVVDGQAFAVRQYGAADRIVLADATSANGNPDLSGAVRAALKAGSEIRLEGRAVAGMAPRTVSFGLLGSAAALATVERFCD